MMDEGGCPKLAEYRSVLMDIAVGDTSACDPAALDEARRHAYACPHCRAELESSRRLIALLKAVRVPDEVVAELGAQLQANLQRRITAWQRRRRLLRWSAAPCAVTAIALLALALWPRPEPETPPSDAVVAVADTPTSARHVSPAPTASSQAPARVAPARRPVRRRTAPDPQPTTPEQQELLAEAARLRQAGRRHVQARQYDRAEEPLRKAVALMNKLLVRSADGEVATAALYEKYRCHKLLGEYLEREDALRAYVQTVRQREGDAVAATALVRDARGLIRECDTASAGLRLERALALCPTGPVAIAAHMVMGVGAERAKQYHMAESEYRMALALGPPVKARAAIHQKLMLVKAKWRDYDAAIEEARTLCSLPGQAVTARSRVVHQCYLARLYAESGEHAKAVQVLREAIDRWSAERPGFAAILRTELKQIVAQYADESANVFN